MLYIVFNLSICCYSTVDESRIWYPPKNKGLNYWYYYYSLQDSVLAHHLSSVICLLSHLLTLTLSLFCFLTLTLTLSLLISCLLPCSLSFTYFIFLVLALNCSLTRWFACSLIHSHFHVCSHSLCQSLACSINHLLFWSLACWLALRSAQIDESAHCIFLKCTLQRERHWWACAL